MMVHREPTYRFVVMFVLPCKSIVPDQSLQPSQDHWEGKRYAHSRICDKQKEKEKTQISVCEGDAPSHLLCLLHNIVSISAASVSAI